MRSLALTALSFVLTATVVGNAYYQKKQFYPSVVYITKSNPSMAVMYVQALVFVVMMGQFLRSLFFGQLRAAEMEHLIERSWYAVTETCLAFTVFRDDFSPRFVALFTLLLFLKCFHWLAEDRVDYMERSPAISWKFHFRALSLMFLLSLSDCLFVRHAFYSTLSKGPSVQLVFGFEYEILLTVVLMTFIKYILHAIDLQSQNPWDNKAVYLLYSELVIGLIRVILYVAFVFIMIKVHTFPLFAIRPMYLTIRAFHKAAQDVILSRRAIRNMNTLYADATAEELSSGDNVCIICREEMVSGSCKKLPCNHIFHTSCLRSWFQRQQTCPTCRLEVLRMPRQPQQQQQPEQQQQQNPAQNQANAAQANQIPPNPFQNLPGMFGGMPLPWNAAAAGAGAAMPPPFPPFMWPPQAQQQQQQANGGPATTSATTSSAQQQAAVSTAAGATDTSSNATPQSTSSSTTTPTSSGVPAGIPSVPTFPGFVPPPSPMFMPGMMPPPMFPSMAGFPAPPASMSGLSAEELQAMEGIERANVEARIHWLRDIHSLLDGAMLLINQYNTVAANVNSRHPAGMQGFTLSTPASSAPSSTSSSSSSSSQHSSSHQQQPNGDAVTAGPSWWPAGSGARPKYSSTISSTHTTHSTKKDRSNSISSDKESVKEESTTGSVSAASSVENSQEIPHWANPREEEHSDEMHEVRKRRLQHFSQQLGDGNAENSVASDTDKKKTDETDS